MSDRMKCMPFSNLIEWIVNENKNSGTIFGQKKFYKADEKKGFNIYKEHIETPIGPAAGPNSQLAQNIVAAYVSGARFFELKTVQEMNGDALAKCVNKPCILAKDEGYNCEWSTELFMKEAIEEYIKAWFALHFIAKEYNLGAQDGFVFNMSVGYNLDDIKKYDTDNFINVMKDGSKDKAFDECKKYLLNHISEYKNFTKEDVENIPTRICDSATESTLHGCPPDEIERIAVYLMTEKKLNTFIKCNPTLLGYERARAILNEMGFTYIAFTDSHFLTDLQYKDVIPMLDRLMKLAEKNGLTFGVKLTNTFPVDVTKNELPSNEMYMSGKALFPLSLKLAIMLSTEFNGKLKISYSGGADYFNIEKLVSNGIWPVTVATTILKPGGYDRLNQLATKIMAEVSNETNETKRVNFDKVNVEELKKVSENVKNDEHYVKKSLKKKMTKCDKKSPLLDCYIAHCSHTCPAHQDISLYNYYVENGEYVKALETIYKTNPLPFMTGNICPHNCMTNCMRNHYESSVNIRKNKLIAARKAYKQILANIKPVNKNGKKVGIVGAGPAGIASAVFLARNGFDVIVFDKESVAGGTVANIIPKFRLPEDEVQNDVDYAKAYGVKFELGKEILDISSLKKDFDFVIIAIGAHKSMKVGIVGEENCINAHTFLREFNESRCKMNVGKSVAVIGCGNTAIDCVRAATRLYNVEKVYLIYRRDMANAPADDEEIKLAIEEGVIIKELVKPESYDYVTKKFVGKICKLGEVDVNGRNTICETDEKISLDVNTVITSIGEKVDTEFYTKNGIEVNEKGLPKVSKALETSIPSVYVVGDGAKGASIIINAVADAKIVATSITNKLFAENEVPKISTENIYEKRAILCDEKENADDRCLHCNTICEVCTEVCPNRANVVIELPDKSHQVVHVDAMCNECGNCEVFCPYDSKPYKNKFTLFSNDVAMNESTNEGFYYKNEKTAVVRLDGKVIEYELGTKNDVLGRLADIINVVNEKYKYMIF